jgi:hypothetical protein
VGAVPIPRFAASGTKLASGDIVVRRLFISIFWKKASGVEAVLSAVGIGNGQLHVGRAGPTRGPGVLPREVRGREMAAGEGDYHYFGMEVKGQCPLKVTKPSQ